MTCVCDEGIDRQIVLRLRRDGHQVLYVAELAPGTADDVVLAEANARGALLVTTDKDFGELVFRQRRIAHGVLLVRLAGLSAESKAEAVSQAISGHGAELAGRFSVLSPGRLRVRPAI